MINKNEKEKRKNRSRPQHDQDIIINEKIKITTNNTFKTIAKDEAKIVMFITDF